MEYEVGADEPVSTAVVHAVSAIERRGQRSPRPLPGVLDPDTPDVLFEPRFNGEPRIGGRLSFVYANCVVTVENGECLSLDLLDIARYESQERNTSYRYTE